MFFYINPNIKYENSVLQIETDNEINKSESILFIYKNQLISGKINYKIKGNNFNITENNKFYLKNELIKFFKNIEINLTVDENFYKNLILYNNSIPLEQNFIFIKMIKDAFIRFIYFNPVKKIYSEFNLDINEFFNWEKEFKQIKSEVDFFIKSNDTKEIKKYFDILKNSFIKFINKIGIPIEVPNKYYTKLNIIYDSKNFYLPFEIISDFILVTNSLISKNRISTDNKYSMKILYSNELLNSIKESFSIINLLENRFNIELIEIGESEKYLTEIQNAGTIHIISHGEVNNNKGYIKIGSKRIDRLSLTGKHNLFFINSCLLGLNIEGIIENLLNYNCNYVIATPFEINDYNLNNKFYFFYNPEYVEISYHIFSIFSNDFKNYYRFFDNYIRK